MRYTKTMRYAKYHGDDGFVIRYWLEAVRPKFYPKEIDNDFYSIKTLLDGHTEP